MRHIYMRSLIKYLHAVALMAATLASYAVEPTWSIDFCSVFDNREGDNRYTDTKTFFFTSLAPELGLSFSETDRIAGGVVWNQPIGCEWDGHRVSPTLYYRHDGSAADSPWSFSMGMFPRKQLREEMPGYASVYAENFHTANLFYPFHDPIGRTNAGILTLSRYRTDRAVRRSFPVTTNFIDKLFDLDRCFAVHYLPVAESEKELVLINLHMSAYDEGGTIRAEQLKMLNAVLAEERDKGNYVIAGGDFNHCLIADRFASDEEALQYFKSEQKTPDWVKNSVLHQAEIAQGFSIAASLNAATCRGADIPYTAGVNYSTVIDGLLVSDNVTVIEEETVDTQFAYSDHNPVRLKFRIG